MEQAKTKKKKKGWVIVVIIVVLLAGIAGGIAACSKSLSESIQQMGEGLLETSVVERRDIKDYISVSGQVESENMVKITSTLTAKVKSIPVDVGSEVKAGDILCTFDSEDLQTQYDQLLKTQQNSQGMSENTHRINERNLQDAKNDRETTLAQAQRAINDACAARDNAYNKERELVDKFNATQVRVGELNGQLGAAESPEAYTQISAQLEAAQAQLQSIDASLQGLREQFASFDSAVQAANDAYASADRSTNAVIQNYQDVLDNEKFSNDTTSTQTELDKLQDMIDQCVVRAPKAGIITSLNIAEGSIPTTDALMTIENTDALKITVSIAEADILKLHEGMAATVKTNATGDEEFAATVSRVVNIYKASASASPYGGDNSSTGGYSAEITIDDPNTDLLIGMTAKVQIVLQEKKDVLSVPFESIIKDEDGISHVLIADLQADGSYRAKAAEVTPGMEGTYYTEITSDVLKEGDKIVMTPGDYQDGDVLPIFDFGAAVNAASSGSEGDSDE